jgi:hypothetical protein
MKSSYPENPTNSPSPTKIHEIINDRESIASQFSLENWGSTAIQDHILIPSTHNIASSSGTSFSAAH